MFVLANCEKKLKNEGVDSSGNFVFKYKGKEYLKDQVFVDLFTTNYKKALDQIREESASSTDNQESSSSTEKPQNKYRNKPTFNRDSDGDRFGEHHGSEFDRDYDGGYGGFGGFGGGFGGHRDRELPPTSCPKPSEGFCLPIPNSKKNDYRDDQTVANFAWKLFKNSNTQPNYALSPLSPQILLSYLTWVANGTTKDELAQANGFSNPSNIEKIISGLSRGQSGKAGREIEIATAFFVDNELR